MDVIFISELEELLPSELRVVVSDNGVWYSKAMDDIKEEQHSLLGLDRGDQLASIHFVNLSTVTSKWV